MKRSIKVFMWLVLLLGFSSKNYAGPGLEVKLNDESLDLSGGLILEGGSSYISLDQVLRKLDTRPRREDGLIILTRRNGILALNLADGKIFTTGNFLNSGESFILRQQKIFIPLRLASDALGFRLIWEPKSKLGAGTIHLYDIRGLGSFKNKTRELSIFMEEEDLVKNLGQPKRKDKSIEGGLWYIYNNQGEDYKDHIQVRVKNSRVVEVETNSQAWILDNKFRNGQDFKLDIDKEIKELYRSFGIIVNNRSDYQGKLSFLNIKARDFLRFEDKSDLEQIRSLENRFFDFTNSLRLNQGLAPLKRHKKLDGLAGSHSREMAEKNYFSHYNYKGEAFEARFFKETSFNKGGENIAYCGYSPSEALNGLYNSKDHRDNILGDFTYLGVGIARGGLGTNRTYFTQNFAK